jgi:multicomponent Na+:H+ antiporter subunit C
MSPNVVLILVAGGLIAAGVYLLLERSLTRVLLGIIIMGNGANLLFLVAGGKAGGAPIVGATDPEDMSDPLPQAMALTAIVITLGITAFLLAMAHRSWQLHGHDEVQDDYEDRRIVIRAERDQASDTHDLASDEPDDATEYIDDYVREDHPPGAVDDDGRTAVVVAPRRARRSSER